MMWRYGARSFTIGSMKTIRCLALLLLVGGSAFAQTIPDYDRDDWNHWIDNDGDCLDTRHEILLRESLTSVTFKQSDNCKVVGGLSPGNSNDRKPAYNPLDLSGKQGSTCSFNTDCGVGGNCVKSGGIYGTCL